MAAAHLKDADCDMSSLAGRVTPAALRTIQKMLEQRFNTPQTSSAGRLFDTVAVLAGLRTSVSFEAQAAMELEWQAMGQPHDGAYPFELIEKHSDREPQPAIVLDTRPLIRAVAQDAAAGTSTCSIARRFHTTLIEMIAVTCGRIRRATGIGTVVLSGGVFMNGLLTHESIERLTKDGVGVSRHRRVPPNDGGLSLGQLAVAAAALRRGSSGPSAHLPTA